MQEICKEVLLFELEVVSGEISKGRGCATSTGALDEISPRIVQHW